MAIIGVPFTTTRPQYAQKIYVAYPWRGQIRVMAWPRARGLPKDHAGKKRLSQLAMQVAEYKMTDGYVAQGIREQAEQRRMRPQDLFLHIQSGRAYLLKTKDGKYIWPMRFRALMSYALDNACAAPAALAVRQQHRWRGITGGTTGARLMIKQGTPQWENNEANVADPYPTTAAQNVSRSMDSIGMTKGAIMVRGAEWWYELPPGPEGSILQIGEDGFPEWVEP